MKMTERFQDKLLLIILAAGLSGIIAVLGFFAMRLVEQQDRHAEVLGTHDRQIERLDVRVGHLEQSR